MTLNDCKQCIAELQNGLSDAHAGCAQPILEWTKPKIYLSFQEKNRQETYNNTNRQAGIPRMVRRGEIYLAVLGSNIGSEQCGNRPVIIIQDETISPHSPTIVVIPMTDYLNNKGIPKKLDKTEVVIENHGLSKKSIIRPKQIRCISKNRLKEQIGSVDEVLMNEIEEKLKMSLCLK